MVARPGQRTEGKCWIRADMVPFNGDTGWSRVENMGTLGGDWGPNVPKP